MWDFSVTYVVRGIKKQNTAITIPIGRRSKSPFANTRHKMNSGIARIESKIDNIFANPQVTLKVNFKIPISKPMKTTVPTIFNKK